MKTVYSELTYFCTCVLVSR